MKIYCKIGDNMAAWDVDDTVDHMRGIRLARVALAQTFQGVPAKLRPTMGPVLALIHGGRQDKAKAAGG